MGRDISKQQEFQEKECHFCGSQENLVECDFWLLGKKIGCGKVICDNRRCVLLGRQGNYCYDCEAKYLYKKRKHEELYSEEQDYDLIKRCSK